jgi:hypothetical protein
MAPATEKVARSCTHSKDLRSPRRPRREVDKEDMIFSMIDYWTGKAYSIWKQRRAYGAGKGP